MRLVGVLLSALCSLSPLRAPDVLHQEKTVIIERMEREDYTKARTIVEAAAGLLATDPADAVQKLSDVIANPKVARGLECRLKMKNASGGYDDPVDFFPFQARGQAYRALAKKEKSRAVELLGKAIDDLKKSFEEKRVASSEALLADALKELETAKREAQPKPPVEDPFKKLEAAVQEHLDARRYRSARDLVIGASGVSEAQKRTLIQLAETESAKLIARYLLDFRRELKTRDDLLRLSDADRTTVFLVPAGEELITASPALQWARKHRDLLFSIGRTSGATVLQAAKEATGLDERPDAEGPNPWFVPMAQLAADCLASEIRPLVRDAASAPKAKREELAAQARARFESWKAFVAGLDPAFRARHPKLDASTRALEGLLADLPVELTELARIDLDACFGPEADSKLGEILKTLSSLEARPGVLASESRRQLALLQATASALRELAAGHTEDEAAETLRRDGLDRKLRSAGVTPESSRYGPRVTKVLDLLLR